jgi:hemolysin III
VVRTVWEEPPKWASAAIYVGFGSVAVLFLPDVVRSIGTPATTLMLLGGALYMVGAIAYGLQWPDPAPAVFGYHEVFHALVIAAATVHFVAIAVYIIPDSATP